MALPANLSYFLSRMQGVSTNRFKIYPNNTGTATPNKIVRFELPSNSLLNLKSMQMMFTASTSGANAGGRLPLKEKAGRAPEPYLRGGSSISGAR